MNYILLVNRGDNRWQKVFDGGYGEDSKSKCEDKSSELDDSMDWMIVKVIRIHMGPEVDIING